MQKLTFASREIDSNPNEIFDDFSSKLSKAFYASFPLVRVSRNKFRNQRWFDSDCNRLFKKKTALYRKFCKTKNLEDKRKYDDCNKRYKSVIKSAKYAYNKKLINHCKNDVRATWKFVNNLLGKGATCTRIRIELGTDVAEVDNTIPAIKASVKFPS